MNSRFEEIKQTAIIIVGGVVGGVLGYFVFFWLISQGFYGMIAPGALVGLGASFGRTRSAWAAVGCGVYALILSLFCEWHRAPFYVDPSFVYFAAHLQNLDGAVVKILMMAAGTGIAFWVPYRRSGRSWKV